ALRIPDLDKVVALTQTTLSVYDTREIIEVLKARFPRLVTPAKEDICYATQNRQDAVKQLAKEVDEVLVIGSRNSENSNQLCRMARLHSAQAFLINNHHDIESNWLQDISQIGMPSGAPVPEQPKQETAEFFTRQRAEIAHPAIVD